MFRFYSKTPTSTRVTVVGEHSDGMLKIAVARCSRKDRFIRAKGRKIAEARLMADEIIALIKLTKCDVHSFVNIAKTIAEEVAKTRTVH